MISDKKYGVSLQVLIILFSFMVVAVPATAVSPPVVLEGSLMVDGSPAPVGTEVKLVADGQAVGETTVTNAGLFGDERSNRLGVSLDYSVVTVYVNGVETTTLDLSSYQNGEVISLDLSATNPAPPTTTTESKSSGGGGGFSSATTETTEEVVEEFEASQPDETIVQSTIEEEVADEVAGEEESAPVSGVSSMIAIFGLILVGAVIVSYRYKSKK